MKLIKLTLLPLALGFFALAGVSCQKQTATEEIAEDIEEVAEEVSDAVEEATE